MNFFQKNCALCAVILATATVLTLTACGKDEAPGRARKSTSTAPVEQITLPTEIQVEDNSQTAFLGHNLYITDIGNYTGAYMEDGSNEIVTDVLMIILKNEGETDLQLARIDLEYSDFTANFEATNLPAGESVVLLEKNRHAFVSDYYLRATAQNVAFFQEQMSTQEDKVKITGDPGKLTVENLTGEAMGEIYIYYKNSAVDLLYGGITYRTHVEAGLEPGKTAEVNAGHYTPTTATVVDVQILPLEE